ncbi:unnamed protein product [Absidia cylindrospora]
MIIPRDEKIPNEILAQIFGYLPPPSLHAAARVNSRWFQVAQILGVYHFVVPSFLQPKDDMMKYVGNHLTSTIDGSRIRHMLILSDCILPNDVFQLIQRLCPNIVSFDYDPDLLTTDMNIASNRKRHKFLSGTFGWKQSIAHFPACHFGADMQWDNADLCRRLETYYGRPRGLPLTYLVKHYVYLNLPRLPLLHDLTLHMPLKMKEHHMECLANHCPRLETLTLRDIQLSCDFNRHLDWDEQSLQVKTLKLEYVKFLYIRTLDYFPKQYPNVQSFTLSLDNQSFQPLVPPRNPTSKCFKVIHDKIITLISRFKHLKELTVNVKDYKTNGSLMSQVWPADWVRNHCYKLTRIKQLDRFKINYT